MFQTILTAALCVPENTGDESRPMTAKRTTDLLDVNEKAVSLARERAKRLKHDLHPRAAIEEGAYWYHPRSIRSDATSLELTQLMKGYWHSDEVSRRASDDLGDTGGVYEEPASHPPAAAAATHPRREPMLPGGGEVVYPKFLESAEYRSFKARQGDKFKDPGRTVFLSTRCKCLTPPRVMKNKSKVVGGDGGDGGTSNVDADA